MKHLELTPEEYDLLEALVNTPAFALLKKVTGQQKEIIKESLVSASSMDMVRTLQGQIAGVNLITTVPEIVAKARAHTRAERKKQEEKEAKRPKRRAP